MLMLCLLSTSNRTPRKRHIKCDETKPACTKCLSTLGICSGYQLKPRKNQSWRHRLAPAAPIAGAATLASQVPAEPNIPDGFDHELERLYFDEWRYLAQVPLSGYTPSKLWSTLMPQLTFQNRSLRHAALGIGAMSQALSVECAGGHVSRSHHHHNAVAYYCSALRLLGRGNERSTKLQDAMLASILFASFEGLRSNPKCALQHILFGFILLRETLTGPDTDTRIEKMAPDPGELIREVLFLYSHLAIQSRTVVIRSFASNSPRDVSSATGRPEEEKTRDAHVPKTLTQRLCECLKPRAGLDILPGAFSRAEEAWEYWAVTARRIERYGPQLVSVMNTVFAQDATDPITSTENILQQLQTHPQLLAFHHVADRLLREWHACFEPLFQHVLVNAHIDLETYHSLIHLRLQYLGLCMYILFPRHGIYELVASLTNTCREINELCELLLRAQDHAAIARGRTRGPVSQFTMQTGVTWILMFVALNCRDAIVRGNAVRILDAYPRREGLWDSRAFSAVAARSRDIERETAMAGGSVTAQWHRLCRRVFLFEDAGARIVFRYVGKNAESGGWELVEETAEWKDSDNARRISGSGGNGGGGGDLEWRRRPLTGTGFILQWGRTTHGAFETLFPGMTCNAPKLELLL